MGIVCVRKALVALVLCLGCVAGARAIEVPTDEWNRKMKMIDDMKAQLEAMQNRTESVPASVTVADKAMENKFGPDLAVTTFKAPGKLKISLLTQIWYYNIQRDNRGFFSDPNANGIADNNLANDINSFRVRRVETKFVYDFNECV